MFVIPEYLAMLPHQSDSPSLLLCFSPCPEDSSIQALIARRYSLHIVVEPSMIRNLANMEIAPANVAIHREVMKKHAMDGPNPFDGPPSDESNASWLHLVERE